MGRFWERYLFGDDRDFCWIVKKIEKSSKFFGHFGFFLEDTYTRAEKGINNISHAGKEKNGKNGKKSDHFGIFVEDTCLERSWQNYRLPERKIEKSLKKSDDFQIFLEDTW